jgi:hypothetical protein
MVKFVLSQFGKITIRYSLKEMMKVMHDRKVTKHDRALLRIFCDTVKEAEQIMKHNLFIPNCTHVFAYHNQRLLIWFDNDWYDSHKFHGYDVINNKGLDEYNPEEEELLTPYFE